MFPKLRKIQQCYQVGLTVPFLTGLDSAVHTHLLPAHMSFLNKAEGKLGNNYGDGRFKKKEKPKNWFSPGMLIIGHEL